MANDSEELNWLMARLPGTCLTYGNLSAGFSHSRILLSVIMRGAGPGPYLSVCMAAAQGEEGCSAVLGGRWGLQAIGQMLGDRDTSIGCSHRRLNLDF
jgi:hypothetical protein